MMNMPIISDLMKQGHIWVAPIWNHTNQRMQPRPIVIVGNEKSNDRIGLIVNFITKQEARDEFDVVLKYWQEAGLNHPSCVRTSKPLTILKSELNQEIVIRNNIRVPKGYIGKLNDIDLANILEMCRMIF